MMCPVHKFGVFSHHKCASKWTVKYLSDFAAINGISFFHTNDANLVIHNAELVFIGNSTFGFADSRFEAGIHIIRNPLDIIVSAYHSHRSVHSTAGWPQLAVQRKLLNSCSEYDGTFLTLSFLERAEGPLDAIRTWPLSDLRFMTLRMEDMVENANHTLGRVLCDTFAGAKLPAAESHSFEMISGRKLGIVDEASHYRSGLRDQWRDFLPKPIVTYIKLHYREFMERFYPSSS